MKTKRYLQASWPTDTRREDRDVLITLRPQTPDTNYEVTLRMPPWVAGRLAKEIRYQLKAVRAQEISILDNAIQEANQ